MILYQKRSTPYFFRLLTVIFHPLSFVTVLFLGGLVYAAYRVTIKPPDQVGIMIGVYLGVLLMGFFFAFAYSYLLRAIRTKIVLLEIVPGGLRIHQLIYSRIIETVFSPTELMLDTGEVYKKSGSVGASYRGAVIAYSLTIHSKEDGKPAFRIQDSQQVIGEILEKIDQQKLIPLNTKERKFLIDFQSDRKVSAPSAWRMLVWVFRIAVIGIVVYFGYSMKDRFIGLVDAFTYVPHPIHGTWRLMQGGMGNIVTFNRDSSLTESIDYAGARWKYFGSDSITKTPARIIVLAGEPNVSENVRQYEILALNDSVMDLKRNFDGRSFHMEKNVEYMVTPVGSLIALFENNFLMPVPQEVQSQVLLGLIPESQRDQLPALFFTSGMKHIFLLSGYSGWSAAVFNTETEELQSFENFPNGAADVCSQSLSVVKENEKDLIRLATQCDEGDPDLTNFDIDDNGRLVAMGSYNTSNDWASGPRFINLPRTWFPLYDGTNGKERQQLCGSEASIEIIESDGRFIWREKGYQDVWEAEIVDFSESGGEGDYYIMRLKTVTGEIKQLEIVPDLNSPASFLDRRLYTAQPELFPVNNNEGDCP